MKWTDVKPSTPGWYWWRNHALDEACIVKVYEGYALPKIGGQWSDAPIPEPEEG